jgi:hypothetical protein
MITNKLYNNIVYEYVRICNTNCTVMIQSWKKICSRQFTGYLASANSKLPTTITHFSNF